MDPALLTISLLALLVPGFYLYTVGTVAARLPTLRGRRICLLIAHPDDEAMFFAPAVLALARPELGNHVKILCLSSGDAEGLGDTRKKELVESGLVLGLRRREDVFVVDNPADFPDSMTATWSADKIASLLREAFTPSPGPSKPTKSKTTSSEDHQQQQQATIDVLITFDAHGVSSHPNHISLYHGARTFVASTISGSGAAPSSPAVDLYTLTTVGFARKYAGVLDVFTTLASGALATWRGSGSSSSGGGAASVGSKRSAADGAATTTSTYAKPAALVFVHGFGRGGWATAREAMTTAHVSQMVWFRYGWITLSRYMFMNDLRLEEI